MEKKPVLCKSKKNVSITKMFDVLTAKNEKFSGYANHIIKFHFELFRKK